MQEKLKRLLCWLFPATCYSLQKDIHTYYANLGVKVLMRVHKLELPTSPLMEGEIYAPPELKMTEEAYVTPCNCAKLQADVKAKAMSTNSTTPTDITYYYNGVPLFTCQEGSLLDICIRDMQKAAIKRNTKYISKLIANAMPIQMPKPSKNILEVIRR